MAARKRTDSETWTRLRDAQADDDVREVAAMSPEEVDRELRDAGLDPDAVRDAGLAKVEELRERHVRLGWQMGARAKLERVRARAAGEAGGRRYAGLPRVELIARIEAARSHPRFAGQVGAMFRKRAAAESSDEELASILEDLELAAALQDEGGEGDGGEGDPK